MIVKVRTIVRNNRRLTVQEIADDCGISVGSCDAILTDDLHMKCVCAKFVPQREQRQTIARDLLEHAYEDVQFLKNTVTGDKCEFYMFGHQRENSQGTAKTTAIHVFYRIPRQVVGIRT